jgi:hypothetical protein
MSQFLRTLDTGKRPFSIVTQAECVWCPTCKIDAAKRARYRKCGTDALAFGMMALSLRGSSRDKSIGSALSESHGTLAGALHYSSCGTTSRLNNPQN